MNKELAHSLITSLLVDSVKKVITFCLRDCMLQLFSLRGWRAKSKQAESGEFVHIWQKQLKLSTQT